jgi:hypothetical protein
MKRGPGVVLVLLALLAAPAAVAQSPPPERTYDSPHFTITWVTAPDHPDAPDLSDGDSDGVPDSIEALAEALEAARAAEVEAWGFPEPPLEDGRYPVYVARADGRGYVRAAPGETDRSRATYMVVPPSRIAPAARAELAGFAAHEYFHAIQQALDALEPDWIDEATASWAQHRFDESDPAALAFLRDFVPAPRHPLTATDDRREYGAHLFFRFLSERFDFEIVRDLWDEMASPDVGVLDALENVLSRHGSSIADEWGIFHLWRRRLHHFELGAAYRAVLAGTGYKAVLRSDTVRNESCRLTSDLGESGLLPLSGDYVRLTPHRRGPSAARGLLTVTGPPGTRAFALIDPRRGPVEERMLELDELGVGRTSVAFGRGEIGGIVLGLANGAARGDEATMAYSLRLEGRPKTEISPPGGASVTPFGTSLWLRGSVTCRKLPAEGARVLVTETIPSMGITRVYEVFTGADGTWNLGVTPEARAIYTAELADPLLSTAATQGEHVVGVRVVLMIDVTPLRPRLGEEITVRGEARPVHPGAPVVVEYRRPGGATWTQGGTAEIGADGSYETSVSLPAAGDWEVRARMTSTGDDDHLPGTSPIRGVRVD